MCRCWKALGIVNIEEGKKKFHNVGKDVEIPFTLRDWLFLYYFCHSVLPGVRFPSELYVKLLINRILAPQDANINQVGKHFF
ncbi:hypothetical protein DMA11_20935 [Marinilabiliaceae bacterium JC017]|nr:hypothetical protein DMA11_20935 [Marinilabiliaceae bacterium JC017]